MIITGINSIEINDNIVKYGGYVTEHKSKREAIKFAIKLSEKNNKQLKFIIK